MSEEHSIPLDDETLEFYRTGVGCLFRPGIDVLMAHIDYLTAERDHTKRLYELGCGQRHLLMQQWIRLKDAVLAWRSADVHHAACVLGLRDESRGTAEEALNRATNSVRLLIDEINREEMKDANPELLEVTQ